MDFLSPERKQVAFVYRWLLAEVWLYNIFQVPTYSSTYTVIVRMKYNQTCFAFWKVLRVENLAFYLFIYLFIFFFWRGWGGEMGGKGGLVIGPVFFDFLGSARHIFGFWFLSPFNHHRHLKSRVPLSPTPRAAWAQPWVQWLQCLKYLSLVLWSEIVGIVINHS